jgi:transcriptional regulator of acetoin/glycerol metabolism
MPGESETLGLAELERRAILRAVCQTKGDKLDAARQLGIGKTTLYRKLKSYVQPPRTETNQLAPDWLEGTQ